LLKGLGGLATAEGRGAIMAFSQFVETSTEASTSPRRNAKFKNEQRYESISVSNLDWQGICIELGLSRRESELVAHILRNFKLASIAREMNLSVGTVKTYLQRIHKKLGISGHVQLVLKVMDAQLRLNGRPKPQLAAAST
jgi:DNA-binding NarL/FixJ family response regulator